MTPQQRLRLVFCVALAAISAAAVHAQVVVYLEGECEVAAGDEWVSLDLGDLLYPDDTVRLEPGAYLELETDNGLVLLTRAGIFRLDEVIGAVGRARSSGASEFFTSRLGALLGRTMAPPQTAASGARGEAADPAVPGADGRDADIIRHALALIADGDLEEAFMVLDAGLGDIEDQRFLAYYAYLLGVAAYGLGDPAAAAGFLEEEGPDPDTDYYYDHALLLAQVQIELYAYEDAIGVLEDLTIWYAGAPRDSDVLLLLGIAYLENGETDLALRSLSQVAEEPALAVAHRLLAEIGE